MGLRWSCFVLLLMPLGECSMNRVYSWTSFELTKNYFQFLPGLQSADKQPLLAKILFHDQYAIAESYSADGIDYRRTKETFVFTTHELNALGDMYLKNDLLNQSLSIAIEFYQPEQDFDFWARICKKISSQELTHLIESCDSRTIVRSSTEEEKLKIQQYKQEQKGKLAFGIQSLD